MNRQAYIETSVWSMARAGQNPTLREPTVQFLDECERGAFALCVSDIVLAELGQAPSGVRDEMDALISRLDPLILAESDEAEQLAARFVDEGILSEQRMDDARHVASAFVHEIPLLVSWNYRHIANVRKAERFNAVAVLVGRGHRLEIHTPLEVLAWE